MKPPRPKPFSGLADDLVAWLEAYENYAEASDIDPADWTRLALNYLPDDTRNYLQFEMNSRVLPSFPVLKELLIAKYLGIDPETLYVRLVHDAAQLPNESLLTYGMRFRRLVTLANLSSPQIMPVPAVTKFIDGIRDGQTKLYLTRRRLDDRTRFQHTKVAHDESYLDDFIRLGRTCESSIDTRQYDLASAAAKRDRAAATMLVQVPEPASGPGPSSGWAAPAAAPVRSPSPPQPAAPFDLAELAKQLKQLMGGRQSGAGPSSGRGFRQPRDYSRMVCFNCNTKGHVVRFCPVPRNEELVDQRRARWVATRSAPAASGPGSGAGSDVGPAAPAEN